MSSKPRSWTSLLAVAIGGTVVALAAIVWWTGEPIPDRAPRLHQHGSLVAWWDPIPEAIREASIAVGPNRGSDRSDESATNVVATTAPKQSNISPVDYAGPEACAKCHPKQHTSWSKHPHRWMNTRATADTVVGKFDGSSIVYLGGVGIFTKVNGKFHMTLRRNDIVREYEVTQTIGSRFYQYYVGLLLKGPEPSDNPAYSVDHVLPFGYWIDREKWVPTVHVHWAKLDNQYVDEEDLPSAKRHDPFAAPHADFSFTAYYQCNQCHTTMPLGDLMVRNTSVIGRHAPLALHFDAAGYLTKNHTQLPPLTEPQLNPDGTTVPGTDNLNTILRTVQMWDARDHAVTLGVSCESCHLGAKAHAEGKMKRPRFFPDSPHLFVYSDSPLAEVNSGRTHQNLNWTCGRCHAGGRRQLAAGMATWNSTEYTDAMRGSCYSQLQCVDCHNPHEATGPTWDKSLAADNANCLKCHQELAPEASLAAHTHHDAKGEGSRCMNCHMPRLNEGLQDVVRSHMIFSPTNKEMIEANHPNACNMCHVNEPIDWTLKHLRDWYGETYNQEQIAKNYPHRQGPTAVGWSRHTDQSVRLIGVDVLGRQNAKWALDKMIDALDDPYIINRQFAKIAIEKMLEVDLSEHGYLHYMTAEERKGPIATVREALLKRE